MRPRSVTADNMFNDPPPEGSVYVMIGITVSYNGPDDKALEILHRVRGDQLQRRVEHVRQLRGASRGLRRTRRGVRWRQQVRKDRSCSQFQLRKSRLRWCSTRVRDSAEMTCTSPRSRAVKSAVKPAALVTPSTCNSASPYGPRLATTQRWNGPPRESAARGRHGRQGQRLQSHQRGASREQNGVPERRSTPMPNRSYRHLDRGPLLRPETRAPIPAGFLTRQRLYGC